MPLPKFEKPNGLSKTIQIPWKKKRIEKETTEWRRKKIIISEWPITWAQWPNFGLRAVSEASRAMGLKLLANSLLMHFHIKWCTLVYKHTLKHLWVLSTSMEPVQALSFQNTLGGYFLPYHFKVDRQKRPLCIWYSVMVCIL